MTRRLTVALAAIGALGASALGVSLPPKQTVSFKVTAKKGKNLYCFCVVHPWMQGQSKVG